MEQFQPTKKLQFLLQGDCTLMEIALRPEKLTLRFGNGCKIESLHAVSFVSPDGEETRYERWFDVAPPIKFHGLLGKRLKAAISQHVVLSLDFEDGGMLKVHSHLEGFEAGQIIAPSSTFQVF